MSTTFSDVRKKNKPKEGESKVNEKSASQIDSSLYQPVVRKDSKVHTSYADSDDI